MTTDIEERKYQDRMLYKIDHFTFRLKEPHIKQWIRTGLLYYAQSAHTQMK